MATIGIVITIVLGIAFYIMRCRWQLIYGIIEILVSLVVIFLTFYPPTTYLVVAEFSWQGWFLSKSVGVLAGIYVMVRGLDNIEKGLSPARKAKWMRAFHGAPK
jgi:hypothetical protein